MNFSGTNFVLTTNQGVVGSIPASRTICDKDLASQGAKSFFTFGICAQQCAQQIDLLVALRCECSIGSWEGLCLYPHSSFNILEHVRRCDVEGVTQSEHQAHAWAVAAKLDQGHVVPVNVSPQRQVGLSPLPFCSQAAQCLPECLIWFQLACSKY